MAPRWIWYHERTTVVDALGVASVLCLAMLLVFGLLRADVRARIPERVEPTRAVVGGAEDDMKWTRIAEVSGRAPRARGRVRAKECYHELWESLNAAGYYPYRTGPAGFPKLAEGSTVFWDVAAQIKRVLDPSRIIAPGRYEPAQAESARSPWS